MAALGTDPGHVGLLNDGAEWEFRVDIEYYDNGYIKLDTIYGTGAYIWSAIPNSIRMNPDI